MTLLELKNLVDGGVMKINGGDYRMLYQKITGKKSKADGSCPACFQKEYQELLTYLYNTAIKKKDVVVEEIVQPEIIKIEAEKIKKTYKKNNGK